VHLASHHPAQWNESRIQLIAKNQQLTTGPSLKRKYLQVINRLPLVSQAGLSFVRETVSYKFLTIAFQKKDDVQEFPEQAKRGANILSSQCDVSSVHSVPTSSKDIRTDVILKVLLSPFQLN
jgi:hypothetical protein